MTDTSLRVLMVCMGNICRSPIAEVVLRDRLDAAGLSEQVTVDSCGTGDWHEGEDADPRTHAVLVDHGYSLVHTARGFRPTWFLERDLVLVMDHDNMRSLRRMERKVEISSGVAAGHVIAPIQFLRSYDPALSHCSDDDLQLDVPDPYIGGAGGFCDVLAMIERAVDGVMATKILPELTGRAPS